MSLTIEDVRYGAGREFSGYFAYPTRAKLPLPAIMVIQEAWGLDAHIEDVTRRFALAGYAALAPDVYARNGVRPTVLAKERLAELLAFFNELEPEETGDQAKRNAALEAKPEPARTQLREAMQTMFGFLNPLEQHLPPLVAAAKYLRDEQPATRGQKVAAVGFCMGGGLCARLACVDEALAGAVLYYGRAPSDEQIAALACPLLGHYGATDANINAGIAGLLESVKKHGKRFEHHVYEGAGHAFFNDERPAYDARASRASLARTLPFLEAVLR